MVSPPAAISGAEAHAHKVEMIALQLGAKLLVTDSGLKDQAAKYGAKETVRIAISGEEFFATPPVANEDPPSEPEAIAFLQLTSGSTGTPRGVMLTHRSALHNVMAIRKSLIEPWTAAQNAQPQTVVCWLPLYHDMGLVGCLLSAAFYGSEMVLMRPDSFLARPRLWLEALSQPGMTLSPAPNFAYQLCVDRLEETDLAGLDLSHWGGALSASEMIRPETVAAFNAKFGPHGFNPEALRPCYGLAEATLCVTADIQGRGLRTRKVPGGMAEGFELSEVACTGLPLPDMEVRIAGPDGQALPEGTIGEIRAKGPSIFQGYFQSPEETALALKDGWLCTGDLGFLHDGELYVTGRVKDLLIIHGHNLMPHELEWIAEEVIGGGGNERSGAFSVAKDGAGEQAVVVSELGARDVSGLDELAHEIKTRIGRTLGLPLADLVFVRRGQIPKTTSGKIQRAELRRRYLEGKLERV
jgi:acyl-CoA synthetase (AMP-forming)/AMP-acid ligase II